ncbi:MAG: flap endonuclease-1 [Promethearchaeota archaeon]
MGVDLKDLVLPKTTNLEQLAGKSIAMDAHNTLYQFLATIRQPDGMPLIDSKKRVTSHLSGLFYRTINLIEKGIKPVYVFDGVPPELKLRTIRERRKVRQRAEKKWKEALERRDLKTARKYAQAAIRLTEDMVDESKKLLAALGIPYVQAPSEGEAQAAYITVRGDTWGAGSQDWDALLFNAQVLVRNLTITGRRKLPGKNVYIKVDPELIVGLEVLNKLEITRNQLIDIGILIGTDYNEGVKGVGAKTALSLIKKYGNLEKIIDVKAFQIEPSIQQIRRIYLEPKVTDNYTIRWKPPNNEKITAQLCDDHDFSYERVKKALDRLEKSISSGTQASLETWFGR